MKKIYLASTLALFALFTSCCTRNSSKIPNDEWKQVTETVFIIGSDSSITLIDISKEKQYKVQRH